ncbi:MAG: hypothetical protein RR320_04040 [Oscillospiraceae bacterium]
MTISIENIMIYLGIISFASGMINYIIIKPLSKSISALQAAIDRLDNRLSILDNKIDADRERIAVVEQSAKQAHKRIDRIDKIVDLGGDDK